MFPSTPVTTLVLVLGLYYFIKYRDRIGLPRTVTLKTVPGPCKVVIEDGGSEDVTYIGNNIVLITTGANFDSAPGVMKALDLDGNRVMTLNVSNAPDRHDFMASPHGMTTWRDPEIGTLYVYVLTHPKKEDRIEVFEVTKSLSLIHLRTIADPLFTHMNDLVAVGRDKFYITRFWHFRKKAYFMAEMYALARTGGVVYFDGFKAREVATGYVMPNGINVSPDQSMVYVAEFGEKRLLGFRRDKITNNLEKTWEMDTDTAVDNIEVDPVTGDLWIGCHPHLYKIMDFNDWFGYTLPSQVIRVKIRDQMVSVMEQIYADDGTQLFASTAATYVSASRKLVIGTVFSQTLVCDVKYLSS